MRPCRCARRTDTVSRSRLGNVHQLPFVRRRVLATGEGRTIVDARGCAIAWPRLLPQAGRSGVRGRFLSDKRDDLNRTSAAQPAPSAPPLVRFRTVVRHDVSHDLVDGQGGVAPGRPDREGHAFGRGPADSHSHGPERTCATEGRRPTIQRCRVARPAPSTLDARKGGVQVESPNERSRFALSGSQHSEPAALRRAARRTRSGGTGLVLLWIGDARPSSRQITTVPCRDSVRSVPPSSSHTHRVMFPVSYWSTRVVRRWCGMSSCSFDKHSDRRDCKTR